MNSAKSYESVKMEWKDVLTDIVLKEGWLVSIKSFKQYQALVYETLASQVLQGRDVFVQVFYCKGKCRIVLMPLFLRKGDFPPACSVYLGTTNRKTDAGVAKELPVNTGHCSQSSIFVVLIALLTCSSWSLVCISVSLYTCIQSLQKYVLSVSRWQTQGSGIKGFKDWY